MFAVGNCTDPKKRKRFYNFSKKRECKADGFLKKNNEKTTKTWTKKQRKRS